MKIGMIGTGYVGLVSSVCLASIKHQVVSVDKRKEIINILNEGKSPIYEEHIETLLSETLHHGNICFTTDFSLLLDCDLIYLAVGTPALPNGHADLSQIFEVIDELLLSIGVNTMLVIRSTIPVGTMKKIKKYLEEKGKGSQLLGFCPEFLREGVAISDFLNPKYLVFASETEQGLKIMQEAYQPIIDNNPVVKVVLSPIFETAELIKYTINSFLATKITFMNQIAQLALVSGADIHALIEAIGSDSRIGNEFLLPGPGYGGSCFPKDTRALVNTGISYGVDLSVVKEVSSANEIHKKFIASWVLETLERETYTNSKNNTHTIAIWGLTFKAGTDDVRDSSAITIVRSILNRGGIAVQAYDPEGIGNFLNYVNHHDFSTHDTALEAVSGANVLLVLTEWEEFSKIDANTVTETMKGNTPLVFDTRGILPIEQYNAAGCVTFSFGL